MQKIVLASGNKGKLKEFSEMFLPYQINVLPQSQFNVSEVPETGTTFVENAIIKARHASKITGLPAIADDSGLEVDTLNGAPGIYSARYGGENTTAQKNYEQLLINLNAIPAPRTARFQCILVYMRHCDDPTPIICQAAWEGVIGTEPIGDQGHGYDPIFIPQGFDITAAQMTAQDKNSVSHRGKALKLLLDTFKSQKILS